MLLNNSINKIAEFKNLILDLLFPLHCLDCEQEGAWLCTDCFEKLKFCRAQSCLVCKTKNNLGIFCQSCGSNFYLEGVWIAADYNNQIIADLIKNLKYHFAEEIAETLGNFLFEFIEQNNIIKEKVKETILIPVPLHQKRFRWRSFNQAEKILKPLKNNLNLPVSTELVRIKNTKPQVKLNAESRKENVKNCFAWRGEALRGKNIILVDDVTTTGSTLNECAKTLKFAGAGKIWGLVIANG